MSFNHDHSLQPKGEPMKALTRTAYVVGSLMLAISVAFPEPAHANLFKKIKKTAKKATKAVSHASNSVVKAADDVAEAGDTVLDSTAEVGKVVKTSGTKSYYELKDGGKHIGNLVVEGGKVVATESFE